MSSTNASTDGDRYVATRLDSKKEKQRAKMRYAQLGHDNMSDYLRELVKEDLEDADLPPVK